MASSRWSRGWPERIRPRPSDRPAQPATGAAGARARGGRRRRSPAIQRPTPGRSHCRPRPAESGPLPTDRRACRAALRQAACSKRCDGCERPGYGPELRPMTGARLCRGRRLPGGGVEPRRGRGGHGTSHAAVREAPAHVVPSRPASHLDPARRRAVGRRRGGGSGRDRAASGAQLIGSPIDWRQAATPLMASVGVVIGVITGTIACSSDPGRPR